MTLSIFPSQSSLPGLAWNSVRSIINSTRVLEARSGFDYRAANWSSPKYKWNVNFEFLRSATLYQELQTLFGFCEAQQGQYAPFLYSDPEDNSVTMQGLGTADGVIVDFPLVRAYAGQAAGGIVLNTLGAVYANGVVVSGSDYTTVQVGKYGTDTIRFDSAPSNGVAITADFTYLFPVRFLEDAPEFGNFLSQIWEMKQLEFQSVK